MKRFAAPLFVLALVGIVVTAAVVVQAQSKYQSGLYFIVLIEHGPNWKPQSTDEGAKLKMKAIDGLKNSIGEGHIITAGLVVDDRAADFVMIVDEESEQKVRELLLNAPSIKSGFYTARALTWHAPKGLKLEPIPLEN